MEAAWIKKIFLHLLEGLNDIVDIVDMDKVMQTITIFDQIQPTKEQLVASNVEECIKELYYDTPNAYLKYRLGFVIKKWRTILENETVKPDKPGRAKSNSVFEAIIMDDDRFFETKSVPELLHRLLKSFDKNYKVIDMATILNTISMFENMDIPASQLAQTHLVTYISRLRHNTTNKYLSKRLRMLLRKWQISFIRIK
ncbi:uncharacterized protein LOC116341627 [Contarinia nasturtii]|uniref:uncharacterized protein LOC116341627 n=1 Tax=Contarinia nasturtii TaxID=265458 RepID=UPI0012D440B4|nr:uncharacterized protein LOC116341627 [Contarinia nasturtii]